MRLKFLVKRITIKVRPQYHLINALIFLNRNNHSSRETNGIVLDAKITN